MTKENNGSLIKKKKTSCMPCRLRKVKCDGASPCSRCLARNGGNECVYAKPAPVGRPPRNAVVNKLVLTLRNEPVVSPDVFSQGFIFEHIAYNARRNDSQFLYNCKSTGLVVYIDTIFQANFFRKSSQRNNAAQTWPPYRGTLAKSVNIFDLRPYFVWMAGDVVNIVLRRFSRLKIVSYEAPDDLVPVLEMDESTEFFCPSVPKVYPTNPLKTLPPESARHLIEHFFSIHAYSHLCSKTMILQSYWTDTIDPLLLSVIYGTTMFLLARAEGKAFNKNSPAVSQTHYNVFLEYAHYLLQKVDAETSTSRYQAVTLLALFESIFGYPKRGITLFGVSHMMASQIGVHSESVTTLAAVERELIYNTYWASFNMTIRGCTEMNQLPREVFSKCVYTFPPVGPKTSAAYQFDAASGNIRSFRYHVYHLESFYAESVISHFVARLLEFLPEPKFNLFRATSWHASKITSLIKYVNVEAAISEIIRDFEALIQAKSDQWVPHQQFTIEATCLLFKIHFKFLKSEITRIQSVQTVKSESVDCWCCSVTFKTPIVSEDQEESANGDFTPSPIPSMCTSESHFSLAFSNMDDILRLHDVLPLAENLVDATKLFLSDPENYYSKAEWLPESIITSCIETCAHVFMTKYHHDPWDFKTYQHIQELYTMVQTDVWTSRSKTPVVQRVIAEFLTRYPPPPPLTGTNDPKGSDMFGILTSLTNVEPFNEPLVFDFQNVHDSFPDIFNALPQDTHQSELLDSLFIDDSLQDPGVIPWTEYTTSSADPLMPSTLTEDQPLSLQDILAVDEDLFTDT